KEAITEINTKQPDLVFLDIQMPKIDGFEVLENIDKANTPVIIFVTAYDEYALHAFEVHVVDYLLKSFDKKRFAKAHKRAKQYVRQTAEGSLKSDIERLLDHHRSQQGYLSRLMVKTNDKVIFLDADIISWIEAS